MKYALYCNDDVARSSHVAKGTGMCSANMKDAQGRGEHELPELRYSRKCGPWHTDTGSEGLINFTSPGCTSRVARGSNARITVGAKTAWRCETERSRECQAADVASRVLRTCEERILTSRAVRADLVRIIICFCRLVVEGRGSACKSVVIAHDGSIRLIADHIRTVMAPRLQLIARLDWAECGRTERVIMLKWTLK